MENDNTQANLAKLTREHAKYLGDTHNLTLGEYIELRFFSNNMGLRRCDIATYANVTSWLMNAKDV